MTNTQVNGYKERHGHQGIQSAAQSEASVSARTMDIEVLADADSKEASDGLVVKAAPIANYAVVAAKLAAAEAKRQRKQLKRKAEWQNAHRADTSSKRPS